MIELQQLQFSYRASGASLIDIPNWQMASGEQVFLHGPSGCGKSTLLNLLCGVLTPNSGEIIIGTSKLSSLSTALRDRFRAKNIGYIFQQFNLIPYLNALENLQLVQHLAGKTNYSARAAQDLLSALQIDPALQSVAVDKLSIGQQQRVAIARALINRPSLLIADEASSALDEANTHNFVELLQELAEERQMSLIFASHDMRLAQHFKRVEAMSAINAGGNHVA